MYDPFLWKKGAWRFSCIQFLYKTVPASENNTTHFIMYNRKQYQPVLCKNMKPKEGIAPITIRTKRVLFFPFTYLECKIKQIKRTLHNLAFIFYQIAHNCNHKMIIFYHMCICKADRSTGQPLREEKWTCRSI